MKKFILGLFSCLFLTATVSYAEPLFGGSASAKSVAELETQIVGKLLPEAEALLKQEKVIYRIIKQDGVEFATTMDYSPNRLNLEVKNKKVVKVTRG